MAENTQPNGAPLFRRADDCPAGRCELRTLSASQLGSLLGLIIGLVLYFLEAWRSVSGRDADFFQHFVPIFSATVIYYFLAEWSIEETNFHDLRNLEWPNRIRTWFFKPSSLEFLIRLFVVVLVALSVALPERWVRSFGFTDQVDWGLSCMMAIYELFLVWDAVVLIGGKPEVIAHFFVYDLVCGVLTLLCVWGHMRWQNLATASAFILCGLVFHLTFGANILGTLRRPFQGRINLR
jgi:hypothetical protein